MSFGRSNRGAVQLLQTAVPSSSLLDGSSAGCRGASTANLSRPTSASRRPASAQKRLPDFPPKRDDTGGFAYRHGSGAQSSLLAGATGGYGGLRGGYDLPGTGAAQATAEGTAGYGTSQRASSTSRVPSARAQASSGAVPAPPVARAHRNLLESLRSPAAAPSSMSDGRFHPLGTRGAATSGVLEYGSVAPSTSSIRVSRQPSADPHRSESRSRGAGLGVQSSQSSYSAQQHEVLRAVYLQTPVSLSSAAAPLSRTPSARLFTMERTLQRNDSRSNSGAAAGSTTLAYTSVSGGYASSSGSAARTAGAGLGASQYQPATQAQAQAIYTEYRSQAAAAPYGAAGSSSTLLPSAQVTAAQHDRHVASYVSSSAAALGARQGSASSSTSRHEPARAGSAASHSDRGSRFSGSGDAAAVVGAAPNSYSDRYDDRGAAAAAATAWQYLNSQQASPALTPQGSASHLNPPAPMPLDMPSALSSPLLTGLRRTSPPTATSGVAQLGATRPAARADTPPLGQPLPLPLTATSAAGPLSPLQHSASPRTRQALAPLDIPQLPSPTGGSSSAARPSRHHPAAPQADALQPSPAAHSHHPTVTQRTSPRGVSGHHHQQAAASPGGQRHGHGGVVEAAGTGGSSAADQNPHHQQHQHQHPQAGRRSNPDAVPPSPSARGPAAEHGQEAVATRRPAEQVNTGRSPASTSSSSIATTSHASPSQHSRAAASPAAPRAQAEATGGAHANAQSGPHSSQGHSSGSSSAVRHNSSLAPPVHPHSAPPILARNGASPTALENEVSGSGSSSSSSGTATCATLASVSGSSSGSSRTSTSTRSSDAPTLAPPSPSAASAAVAERQLAAGSKPMKRSSSGSGGAVQVSRGASAYYYGPLLDLPVPVASPDTPGGQGCVGLQNLGNTCFMNSILQSLNAIPELMHYFGQSRAGWSHKAQVAPAYSGLVKEMLSAPCSSVVKPSKFLRRISSHDDRWSGGSQQDSQEFLHSLLEALQDECNRVVGKPQYKQLEGKGAEEAQAEEADEYAHNWHDSVVDDIFGGLLQSTIQCQVCKRQSHCFDPFLDLAVPIPERDGRGSPGRAGGGRDVGVSDCLRAFVEQEQLEGADSYKCEACKQCTPHTKRLQIYRPPRVLILTLKRFSQRGGSGGLFSRFRSTSKNATPVVLEQDPLDLAPYCNPSGLRSAGPGGGKPLRAHYQLMSVSHHSGSLEGGHYTAQARSVLDGAWYNFNDSNVRREAARPAGASSSAYVLFYRLAGLPSSAL